MTSDQSPEAMYASAIGDLRNYVRKPSLYPQRSLFEFARSLWFVYMIRSGAYENFQAWMDHCFAKAEQFKRGVK